MVLDTSALLAVLLNEAGAPAFRLAIEADPVRLLSAASLVETGIVIEARV
jgi:ribonuclease VapC